MTAIEFLDVRSAETRRSPHRPDLLRQLLLDQPHLMSSQEIRNEHLQAYPRGYTMTLGLENHPPKFHEKGGPLMSDGSRSRRHERHADPKPAEPPSIVPRPAQRLLSVHPPFLNHTF
jgi:hypothetical protein